VRPWAVAWCWPWTTNPGRGTPVHCEQIDRPRHQPGCTGTLYEQTVSPRQQIRHVHEHVHRRHDAQPGRVTPSPFHLHLTVCSVYRCTRTHSPHPPPGRDRDTASPPFPAHQPGCLLTVHRCTRTHSPHPPPYEHVHRRHDAQPGRVTPSPFHLHLTVCSVYRCTRTHSPHPPPGRDRDTASPPFPAHQPGCLLTVHRCTRTHSPHPPPYEHVHRRHDAQPGRVTPSPFHLHLTVCSVYRCTRTHSPHPPPRRDRDTASPPFPAHQPGCLLTVHRCTRTHSPHPPPWPGLRFPPFS